MTKELIVCLHNDDDFDGLFNYFKNNETNLSSVISLSSTPPNSEENQPKNVLSSVSTFFYSVHNKPWIQVEFINSSLSLTGFTIKGIVNPYPKAVSLHASNDNVHWIRIYYLYEETNLCANHVYYQIDTCDYFRYFRFFGENDSHNNPTMVKFGLFRIELFGIIRNYLSVPFYISCHSHKANIISFSFFVLLQTLLSFL